MDEEKETVEGGEKDCKSREVPLLRQDVDVAQENESFIGRLTATVWSSSADLVKCSRGRISVGPLWRDEESSLSSRP